jgi:site-specific DNA recombinase
MAKTVMNSSEAANKKRAVIYARYSTKGQNDISVEDQITLCRKQAERDGSLHIIECYADRAKSGAGTLHRDELNKLLAAAKRREFDVLILESLDRLSRDLADMAGMWKDLKFWGIEIRTVNEGTATNVMIALRGLMGEMFLKDVGDKINRHHAGRARDGKIPGALSYGYRLVTGKPGDREIDPEQAKIVVRIFEDYASGVSPRTIAERLNADGIYSPAGKQWTHQAIGNGPQKYGKGIINNRLYLGELHWNRRYNIKNPETENKVTRPRDEKDWIVTSIPHLRIISDKLWQAAHQVRSARAKALKSAGHGRILPRAKSLLAGILRCGVCGADMRISTGVGDLRRIVCSAADKNRLICQHGRSYDLKTIEHEAISFVRNCFANPKWLRHFVETFEAEYAAEQKRAQRETGNIEKRLLEIEGSIRRFVHALEINSMPEQTIIARLQELEAERVSLNDRRRLADEEIAKVSLHPAAIKRWHTDLCFLADKLEEGDFPDSRIHLGRLLEGVIVHPTKKKAPYQIEPRLRAGALSAMELFPPERTLSEIAGEQGVSAFSDSGNREVAELPISKNGNADKAVISLGILTGGKVSAAA